MAFNRIIVPSDGGQSGKLLADFLRVEEDAQISMTELQSYLYDRLYRLGMVRHLDGTRALRSRRRRPVASTERQATAKRQEQALAARRTRAAKARAKRAKTNRAKTSDRPRSARARAKSAK
mgnify:CR=1 FL=1